MDLAPPHLANPSDLSKLQLTDAWRPLVHCGEVVSLNRLEEIRLRSRTPDFVDDLFRKLPLGLFEQEFLVVVGLSRL